jgi:hypothetical protein
MVLTILGYIKSELSYGTPEDTAEYAYAALIRDDYNMASFTSYTLSYSILRGMWNGIKYELGEFVGYDPPIVLTSGWRSDEICFNSNFGENRVTLVFSIKNHLLADIEWFSGLGLAEDFFQYILINDYENAANHLHLIDLSYNDGTEIETEYAALINKGAEIKEIAGGFVSNTAPYFLEKFNTYCFPCKFENGDYVVGVTVLDSKRLDDNDIIGYCLAEPAKGDLELNIITSIGTCEKIRYFT